MLKPKHHRRHKRSLNKDTEAEDAVLEELGIMDNPVEKARLRRSLEVQLIVIMTTSVEKIIEKISLEHVLYARTKIRVAVSSFLRR